MLGSVDWVMVEAPPQAIKRGSRDAAIVIKYRRILSKGNQHQNSRSYDSSRIQICLNEHHPIKNEVLKHQSYTRVIEVKPSTYIKYINKTESRFTTLI